MSTTITPAPVTPPPRLGATPPTQTTEPPRSGVPWPTVLRWAGDATAIVLLATVLLWLAGHDGGRHLAEFLPVVWVAAAFLPWASAELRRMPRTGTVLVAALMLGAVASIAFGTVRTSFEVPAVTFATTIVTGLAAHRVWRRDWGPVAVFLLLVVGFGLYWQRSFLQWWGGAGNSGTQWLALSWHNQSGTLMAAFGLTFLGVAIVGRRLLVPAGLLLASGGFAGLWLSGSRGALAATVIGLAVVVVVGVRDRGLWRTAVVGCSAIALTVGAVGWLTFVRTDVAPSAGNSTSTVSTPAEDPLRQPVFERDEDAGANALRRLQHVQAAVGMFADRPLTGHGLGAYGPIALRWSSPEANLTLYAHNRYAQTLGEGGLAAGGPLLGLLVAAGVLAWRRIWVRAGEPVAADAAAAVAEWAPAITAGLTAAGAMIAVHSMIDFDWSFPILPMLLAITAGVLSVDHARPHPVPQAPVVGVVSASAVGLLLLTGVGAHLFALTGPFDADAPPDELAASFRPWQASRGAAVALALSDRGEHGHARAAIETVDRWSPGLSSTATERAVIAYRAGQADADDVADTLKVGEDWFGSFNLAASTLIKGGDHPVARDILATAVEAYPRYDAWDRGANEAESYTLLVRSLSTTGECSRARSVVDGAPPLELVDLEDVLTEVCGRATQ